MSITDVIRRAGRSLRHAKARTLLTSLAIAVGAFTLTLSLAAGEGARQYANDLISSNTDTKELFVSKTSQEELLDTSTPREYSENTGTLGGGQVTIERLSQKDFDLIEKQKNVSEVTPIYNPRILYITREGQKRYTGNVEMYGQGSVPELVAGELPSKGKLADDGLVISNKFAEALGFKNSKDALGEEVMMRVRRDQATVKLDSSGMPPKLVTSFEHKDMTYRIVGVSTQGTNALSAPTPLLVSRTAAKEMATFINKGSDNEGKYIGAVVRVNSEENIKSVQSALKDKGFEAESAEDLQGVLFTIVNVLQGITLAFGVLAIIASVFGIINTQYISVLERTQQIGLMKALGMRRRDIGRLFRFEAAWIGFLGGVIGAGLAAGFGTAINPWLSKTVGLGDNTLLIFQFGPIATLVVALMIVAIVAGILPARKAAKLDPIEALRTE